MIMSVLVNARGDVLGTMQAPAVRAAGMSAGLMAGPGQILVQIEVPDNFAHIVDLNELHRQVKAYLPKP
jgi:hypothetical protein